MQHLLINTGYSPFTSLEEAYRNDKLAGIYLSALAIVRNSRKRLSVNTTVAMPGLTWLFLVAQTSSVEQFILKSFAEILLFQNCLEFAPAENNGVGT